MTNQTHAVMSSIFNQCLPALKGILEKAAADAEARGIDPQVFLGARLAPDMFTFTRQVQIATDQVRGGMARLAGETPPSWEDNEATFAELIARVQKAHDFVQTFSAEQYAGAETRHIELHFPGASFEFSGKDYLMGFVIPNFYFHMTAAYAILRNQGVALGKRDFLGG